MNNSTVKLSPEEIKEGLLSGLIHEDEIDRDKLEHMDTPIIIEGFDIETESLPDQKNLCVLDLTIDQSNYLLKHMATNRSTFEEDIQAALYFSQLSDKDKACELLEVVIVKLPLYTFRRTLREKLYKRNANKELLALLSHLENIMSKWKALGVDYIIIGGLLSLNCNIFENE